MKIEDRVIIKKTLKAGDQIWPEGSVLEPPLPAEIVKEVLADRDTVVFEGDKALIMPRAETKFDYVSTPEYKGGDDQSTMTTIKVPDQPKLIKRKK
jgi:hypothetical protein